MSDEFHLSAIVCVDLEETATAGSSVDDLAVTGKGRFGDSRGLVGQRTIRKREGIEYVDLSIAEEEEATRIVAQPETVGGLIRGDQESRFECGEIEQAYVPTLVLV